MSSSSNRPYSEPAIRRRRKVKLPPAVAERLKSEIARTFDGDVYIGASTHRNLMQALRPHEAALSRALCRNSEILPDGTIRLPVPRNIGFLDAHLDTHKWEISVEYHPKSGKWRSEVAAGAGLDQLCAHVWRIQGRSKGMATRKLLALIGAAYLSSLAHGGRPVRRRRSIDFARIASAACSNADAIVTRWLPDGRREGREWVARNPKRGDSRPGSFKVNLSSGRWGDFASNDRGGDLIALASFLFDLKQNEAAVSLAEMLGLDAYE